MIYIVVHSLRAVIEAEMALVVQEADNSVKDPIVIRIAGTNLSASGWAILQVVY